ncbi:signal transduction histidine kinase, LytS [Thioalkalivibrio nitratireducens DSM 14787]|uniref:Signal transduction histidine kinase, LytS n=1 Tax=Thioalkalivibrio nitratireducens (strain DSM 14787 / UNIQEM 213 / ALEN2) TaxID=1255043 RepID=L0DTC0_THIND|nr:histidine kinase [Thioalkalivibrio nitratireducens]AGA32240.1 signal transduction histidine kinase, LytS [Thioalkalivibrio nitratireducens DSM 14787]
MKRSETTGTRETTPAIATQVLPDFCSGETVLRVFIVVMLLALIVLLLQGAEPDPMVALYPIAMFITWVGFSSLLVICLLQRWLRRRPLVWQVVIPTAVPVLNTALVHLAAEHMQLADAEARVRVIAAAALLSLIVMRHFYLVAAWKQETRLVAQAREQTLRARVRPHFLFNSMNTIASLCRTDPGRAEQVTLDLADLFRATFATGARHTLGEELDLVRAYLAIEQTRFGDRLQLDWNVPDDPALDHVQVPALILQPLAENAIQHGVAPSPEGGRVEVRLERAHGGFVVEFANGISPEHRAGTGTATEEARARLRHCFGDRAALEVRREAGRFHARITLPADASAEGCGEP